MLPRHAGAYLSPAGVVTLGDGRTGNGAADKSDGEQQRAG
jgi:hypothetical protein